MKAVQERREHERHPYSGPVTYRRLGPGKSGWIRNLGEGGLMAELPERFAPGTPLDLIIAVGGRNIHAEAEVVWSQDRADSPNTSTYCHGLKVNRLELQKGSLSPNPASGYLHHRPKS
jgi:hypothetical protein